MTTAQELIRAEIKCRTIAQCVQYGYDVGSCDADDDVYQEQESELRSSYDMDATGIVAWSHSRHYECKPVVKLINGHWVCWLYWYGGGKHGEPDSIDWQSDARIVTEGEPITFKTFKDTP